MRTFGKYQLHEEIGKGPSGTTYRASDQFRNRELVVKLLHPAAVNPDVQARFCRELAACAELQHPHIVKIHDMGEVDGLTYVATELLHGVDLRRHLVQRQGQTLGQTLKLMAQVCDGLAAAHGKQITHGNIKPSNLFLTGVLTGVLTGDNEAKILDFGVATLIEPPTQPGLPNYQAPEQIMGQPADARSDLFSVAVVLYELLTNIFPFETSMGLMPLEIAHREAEPLRKLDSQIPEELERLVAMALERDPQRRMQTAEALAAGLCAIAEKLPSENAAVPVLFAVSAAAAAGATPGAAPHSQAIAQADAPTPKNVDQPIESPQTVTTKLSSPPIEVIRGRATPRRVIAMAAAAVLGICALVGLLSRQSSHGFQSPKQVHESRPASAVATEKDTAAPPSRPAANQEPGPLKELILSGQVSSLWESGQYEQAMKLVDAILATDPDHAEARVWKKKIRAAQDAEAALR